ncbi:MAG TPA: FkbM family methyltransferase [Abditibacteriaceae bacterium]|jgi:FkbM family methyltransferase
MKQIVQNLFNRFGYELRRTAPHDPFVIQSQLVTNPTPTIFDIGAHIGTTAKQYRDLFPSARVHCFEPFPESFEKLKATTEGDARTTCYQLAVSSASGVAEMNSNASSATNSLLNSDKRAASYWGDGVYETKSKVQVTTTTVDEFCKEHDIAAIDILKLDIQGLEYQALQGAAGMLSSQAVSLIYTELIMVPAYQGQKQFHEYLHLLCGFGYELLDLYSPALVRKQMIQADCIFVSSKFKQQYDRAHG